MHLHADWTRSISDAIQTDAAARIFIVDQESIVLFSNTAALDWLQLDISKVLGRPLNDFINPKIAVERMALAHEAVASQRAFSIDGLIDGEGLRCIIRPMPPIPDHSRAALMCYRQLAMIHPDDQSDIIAGSNDFGALQRLTSREVEVLVMVALGLTSAEIAYKLRRSRRTIDCHRAAISHKLNPATQSTMLLIALRAGLLRNIPNADGDDLPRCVISNTIKHLCQNQHSRPETDERSRAATPAPDDFGK